MSVNARAIATLGFGFGVVAMVTLGFVAADQVATQQPSSGGGGWIAPPNNYDTKNPQIGVEVNHQELRLIAQQHAEDEVMLNIIMSAVTQELLS